MRNSALRLSLPLSLFLLNQRDAVVLYNWGEVK